MNPVPTQHERPGPAGIVISALRGGAGKTILSIGIIAALGELGHAVAPFKKGPDYIDAGWLALAAGRPCYNLDTFLIATEQICTSFHAHARDTDLAVIEGNRGLYDAPYTGGETSTAELAKLLGLPVLLCIDCTKTTRTMAAVVAGCDMFDPDVAIQGVILNRVAGARHESILRRSIEEHCHIPVLGAVPKLKDQRFPERHMGLVPTPEHAWAKESIRSAAEMAARYLDLPAIIAMAHGAGTQPCAAAAEIWADSGTKAAGCTPPKTDTVPAAPAIGVIRDSAFQFYYPENLDALADAGARIVFTSPLTDRSLPPVDALYIGGGFPETHARKLSENTAYRNRIRYLADRGLPVYAECGGLMYLGQRLVLADGTFPMAGVLPVAFGFSKKPQGHGYTVITVVGDNPFFTVGTEIRGHEFHYSTVAVENDRDLELVFRMDRGKGIRQGCDGARYKNVLATYTHIHALGLPGWAEAMVRCARSFQQKGTGSVGDR